MRCEDCGATNLDGADTCSACGNRLSPEEAARAGGGPASRNTWILLGVAAAAALVLVGALMTSGGPGGGGGVAGPAGGGSIDSSIGAAPGEKLEAPPTSRIETLPVTPEQAADLTQKARAKVKKDYPAYAAVTPSIGRFKAGGVSMAQLTYRLAGTGGAKPVPGRKLVVIINEANGEMRFHEAF